MIPAGLGVLSRHITVLNSPLSISFSVGQLFAAYVAPPSCAAKCLVNRVMLTIIFLTASLVANLAAPILANKSTSLFARQPTKVNLTPSDPRFSPTTVSGGRAGTHVSFHVFAYKARFKFKKLAMDSLWD